VRCDVTPTTYRTDFLTVPFVSTPGAPIAVDRSFVVEAGQPGLKPA
jgi:alkaline phosphatase D